MRASLRVRHVGVDVGDLDRRDRALVGRRLELGDGAVDHVARGLVGARPQRPQGHQQGRRLGGGQAQGSRQVVGVGDPDHAVALGGLQGVEVDVDQVVGVAARQPAHQQHLQVGQHLAGVHTQGTRGVVEPDALTRVQERHQPEQPGHLVLGAAGAHLDRRHGVPPPVTASSRRTTSSRTRAGSSTTRSGPSAISSSTIQEPGGSSRRSQTSPSGPTTPVTTAAA